MLCRTPGLASRNPSFLADYENVIKDILTQVQGVVGEHRELSEKVRKQSERIARLERCVAAMGTFAGPSAPRPDVSSGSGMPGNERQFEAAQETNRRQFEAAERQIEDWRGG